MVVAKCRLDMRIMKNNFLASVQLLYIFLMAQGSHAQDKRTSLRSYPSVFQAWNPIENKPDKSELELMAKHDLVFGATWAMRLVWQITEDHPYKGLSTVLMDKDGKTSLKEAQNRRARLRKLNPNLKLLCEIRYREGRFVTLKKKVNLWRQAAYPSNSKFWLKDKKGKYCPGWGEDKDGDGKVELNEIDYMLVDFRNPKLHEIIANKALALKKSGVFDGIMLDWWDEDSATTSRWPNGDGTHLTRDDEQAARIAMLRKIREKVGNKFLIIVNSNYRTVPQSAPFVNGLFMECWKSKYNEGYNINQIKKMETTLLWAEKNLKEPRINCLEGWRVVTAYTGDQKVRVQERNFKINQKWMRMITTLSLTHSNGYVLFTDDNAMPAPDHLHNWYDFWDADLGQPLLPSKKQKDGSFRREFSNGTVIYNTLGNTNVSVLFEEVRRSAATSIKGKRHSVSAGDGDIFLKVP
ncbi:MAG: hypothetical protein COA79_22615 [Planctomycetota bacterium]|nr:MAG: hypothetical protein COA79_22615 [Planctomycetota bacterium]